MFMNGKRTLPPVARIIQRDGRTVGEVTGAPDIINQVDICVHERAQIFGCRFDTTQVKTGDKSILTIEATPRKCHRMGEDPEGKLLQSIFSDTRQGSPGALLHFAS